VSILSIANQAIDRGAYTAVKPISTSLIPEDVNPKTSVESAIGILFSYIPTEVIALYVAVLAALVPDPQMQAQWITFYVFLGLTPIVVWLVYAAKVKQTTGKIPWAPNELPLWEMFASTLAFVAWAFALPNSPFSVFTNWYSSAIAGVVILVTSTILGLVSPFFTKVN
jgi:hypothetical protein